MFLCSRIASFFGPCLPFSSAFCVPRPSPPTLLLPPLSPLLPLNMKQRHKQHTPSTLSLFWLSFSLQQSPSFLVFLPPNHPPPYFFLHIFFLHQLHPFFYVCSFPLQLIWIPFHVLILRFLPPSNFPMFTN